MDWVLQNLATIIISIVLLLVVLFISRHLIRQGKAGKAACGCNCKGCDLVSSSCCTTDRKR